MNPKLEGGRMKLFRSAILLVLMGTFGAVRAEDRPAATPLVHFGRIVVPPVARTDIANLVVAGTIDTDGYKHVVLNLVGELKSGSDSGVLGVMLIPDVPPFDKAFLDRGLLPISMELTATSMPDGRFMARQQTFEVGFPRYRVLLFNSATTTATASFFAYRTH
jgi:hypothetical protein